jgi:hypothetical protein
MPAHKYRVGQIVEAAAKVLSVTPPGRYEIVRLMPPTVGGDNQYRIKSLHDGHERVVKESDLVDSPPR